MADAKSAEDGVTVQAIIFDLDGTLIDYEEASRRAMCDVVGKHGKTVDWKLHSTLLGRKMHDVGQRVVDALDLKSIYTADSFVKVYYERMGELYSGIKPMDGVLDVLNAFKDKGLPMAIATSSYTESYNKKMKFHKDIEAFVELHVCGDDPKVKKGKPAPDIFLAAKARLEKIVGKLEPSKIIVFEDSPFGLEGAYAAGMMGVALPDKRIDHSVLITHIANLCLTLKAFQIAGTDFSKATWVCKDGIKEFLKEIPKLKVEKPGPSV